LQNGRDTDGLLLGRVEPGERDLKPVAREGWRWPGNVSRWRKNDKRYGGRHFTKTVKWPAATRGSDDRAQNANCGEILGEDVGKRPQEGFREVATVDENERSRWEWDDFCHELRADAFFFGTVPGVIRVARPQPVSESLQCQH
jgi:hypothetical protein